MECSTTNCGVPVDQVQGDGAAELSVVGNHDGSVYRPEDDERHPGQAQVCNSGADDVGEREPDRRGPPVPLALPAAMASASS
jgi:hypothetical protein